MVFRLIIILALLLIPAQAADDCGTDFNGVPRCGKYVGDKPEIGAFEYVPEQQKPGKVTGIDLIW